MKFIFAVTGTQKLTDDKLLVQLQGQYGHVSLNLPLSQRLTVGDELILASEEGGIGRIDEIDEVRARMRGVLSEPSGVPGIPPSAFDGLAAR